MKEFGPKLFDALIQVLEEDQGMLPGTLEMKVLDKVKTIPDYDWMKSDIEEVLDVAIKLAGMSKEDFQEAVKTGRYQECLIDLFRKIQTLKAKLEKVSP